jgi:hypothetical protein
MLVGFLFLISKFCVQTPDEADEVEPPQHRLFFAKSNEDLLAAFSLVSRFPLARQGTGVATEFLLHPGEPSTFILRQVEGDGDSRLLEARLVGARAAMK